MEACVKDLFYSATDLIFEENINRIEFDFCVNTIITTINYLKSKRFENEEKKSAN